MAKLLLLALGLCAVMAAPSPDLQGVGNFLNPSLALSKGSLNLLRSTAGSVLTRRRRDIDGKTENEDQVNVRSRGSASDEENRPEKKRPRTEKTMMQKITGLLPWNSDANHEDGAVRNEHEVQESKRHQEKQKHQEQDEGLWAKFGFSGKKEKKHHDDAVLDAKIHHEESEHQQAEKNKKDEGFFAPVLNLFKWGSKKTQPNVEPHVPESRRDGKRAHAQVPYQENLERRNLDGSRTGSSENHDGRQRLDSVEDSEVSRRRPDSSEAQARNHVVSENIRDVEDSYSETGNSQSSVDRLQNEVDSENRGRSREIEISPDVPREVDLSEGYTETRREEGLFENKFNAIIDA